MNTKIKICFLDEDENWRMDAYNNLKEDFDVHIVELEQFPRNVADIWPVIAEAGADVVIVDYRLNESGILSYTGENVVREIRKHNKHLPVFMVTSFENNAILECTEVQIIRGKNVLNTADNLEQFKKLLRAAVGQYQRKKATCESVVRELTNRINKGESLSESEIAQKFDAELYLSELDLDSGVRANMINQTTSQQMTDMLQLAKSIVERLGEKA